MVVLSSKMVSSNKLRQSSTALCSSWFILRRILFFRPLQLEDDNLTSCMVWLMMEEIICGTNVEVRSGKEARVETHRSG